MRLTVSALLLAGLVLAAPQVRAADDFKLEEGFTLLFNGKDLSGWKVQKGDALEGKTEASNKRFQVADGVIVVDAKTKGNVVVETTKEFAKDVVIKFEYLPGEGCNNDLYFRGLKFDIKKPDVKNMKDGEWNTFEIVVKGDEAEFKNNGETMRKEKVKMASVLGVRAELGPIQIRRMRYMEPK